MKLLEEEVLNRGLSEETIVNSCKNSTLFEEIVAARDKNYEQSIQGLIEKEKQTSPSHDKTMQFHGVLVNYNGTPEESVIVQKSILAFNMPASKPVLTHFYFCLDDSYSMKSDWKSLMNALEAFINRRIEICKNSGIQSKDVVTIVNYSSYAEVMCSGVDINNNPENRTRFRSGGTNFSVGLNLVATQMRNCESDYHPVLVFMSDGGCDNGDAEIKQISAEFAPKKIKIFVFGFGCCSTNKLKHMANISGGEFYYGKDAAQLKAEFEAISTKVSSISFSNK